MERIGTVALQGNSRGLLSPLLLFLVVHTTISGTPAQAADAETACRSPFARVVSIQGSVEVLRSGGNAWTRVARLDTAICPGDRLRTGPQSRAALFVQPETLVRVDQNTSATFNQTDAETAVEFTQEEIVPVSVSAHACGAGYFITRFPRKFKVKTPHLNAAVEGTEFLVAMRCESTDLSVIEGKVLAASAGPTPFPAQTVTSGQTLTVGGGEPPAIKLLIKPADAVQWTLYYPPITPADAVPVKDCRDVAAGSRASCLIARAERLLRAGRVDEAQTNISDALAVAPYSSDAKALSSIVSLVKNDKAEALRLAKEATEATPDSAPAWLALSYAQQADFKLEAALTSATRASELTPSSAFALARVAELQLSLGWTSKAEKTAKDAVTANSAESRAHMILGFIHLAQIKVDDARKDFERAIELDSTDPLSRLGLGLAIIRKGNLVEGREQFEIAVALDPTNSLIRSYVGKAYYEENSKERDKLASTQFGLAKELDPKDPTPWFYDAILRQTQNRPVEALESLQKSIELNDNRAVYRSRLLLDEDQVGRASSIARVYQSLGFTRRGLVEAYTSLQTDPSNYSAHQFLADVYATQSRHEIARVSESIQAQLRQPINAPPVEPELADDRLGATRLSVVQGFGGRGFGEYGHLFERSGLGLQLEGIAGSEETVLDQIILSARHDALAFNVGHLHYETDGFELNERARKEIYNAFLQVQLSNSTSLQAEFRSAESERGDTRFAFDPNLILPLRIDEKIENYRIGAHHAITPNSELLISAAYEKRNFVNPLAGFPPAFAFISEWTVSEAQYVWRREAINLVTGLSHFDGQDRIDDGSFTRDVTHDIAYAYAHLGKPSSLVLTLGASVDDLDSVNLRRKQTNPKVGISLYPWEGATLRAAWFRLVKRQIIANQTIEPTSVAGFNQFFDDPTGSNVQTAGAGIDQRFGSTIFVGFEFTNRRLDVPSVTETSFDDLPWRERNYRGYLYWAVSRDLFNESLKQWSFGLSVELQKEKLERDENITGVEGIHTLDTSYVPLAVSAHHTSGLSFRLAASKVRQNGELRATPDDPVFLRDETFWITDLDIGYRLPSRYGFLSLGVRNLFDRSSTFVETDPVVRHFAPKRFVFGRLSLSF